MKIRITEDELYPYYWLSNEYGEREIEISEETYRHYTLGEAAQSQLELLYKESKKEQ